MRLSLDRRGLACVGRAFSLSFDAEHSLDSEPASDIKRPVGRPSKISSFS
jgi:hypothetical protein